MHVVVSFMASQTPFLLQVNEMYAVGMLEVPEPFELFSTPEMSTLTDMMATAVTTSMTTDIFAGFENGANRAWYNQGVFDVPSDEDEYSPFVSSFGGKGTQTYYYTDNHLDPVLIFDSIAYEVTGRKWYQDAQAGGAHWTDVYTYVSPSEANSPTTGLSVVVPLYDQFANFVGVIGSDLHLEFLGQGLASLADSMRAGTIIYIAESTQGNPMIAASIPGVSIDRNGRQVSSFECDDDTIRMSAISLASASRDELTESLITAEGYWIQAKSIDGAGAINFAGGKQWYIVTVEPAWCEDSGEKSFSYSFSEIF